MRGGIENDLYAFTKGRRYPLTEYLNFVESYCFAAKYPLNMSVLQHLSGLYSFMYYSKSDLRNNVQRLLKEYGIELLKQVGWIRSGRESTITTKMRSAAIFAAGLTGDATTIHKAGKLFSMAMEGKRAIEPNLRSAVYGTVAFHGNADIFDMLVKKYKAEEIPEDKIRYLQSLGMFNDEAIAKKALDFSMSKEVRYQDGIMIPSVVSSRPVGRKLIWNWTKKNWHALSSKYLPGTYLLSYFIDNLAVAQDEKTLKDIGSFFRKKANTREDITRALKQANEIATINIRFLKENGV